MRKNRILIRMAVLVLSLAIWTIWANTALERNTIVVTGENLPDAFSGYRIAHISDFHNTQNGTLNAGLVQLLKENEPDMIAITGDLIDSRRTDVAAALQFVEQAVKIAPCYYVTGNHESRVVEYDELKSGLEALGVEVLENESLKLQKDDDEVILIGVNDPKFMTRKIEEEKEAMERCLEGLVSDGEDYQILLSHRPELFEVYVDAGLDLVLSGHAHGGQFRLPFIGGLIAPNQGFFPRYDAGAFTESGTNMIVSRGIGNSIVPVRFNNRPEVILVELRRGE